MTTNNFLAFQTTKKENFLHSDFYETSKKQKNYTPKYDINSTSIKSPSQNSDKSNEKIYEKYSVKSFNVYDNDDNNFDEDDNKIYENNKIFNIFQNQIQNCQFIFMQKKRPYTEEKNNQLSKFTFNNNKEKLSSIEIMNDFDKMSIEISDKRIQKKIEIKKDIVKKRTDFSIFDKPFPNYSNHYID